MSKIYLFFISLALAMTAAAQSPVFVSELCDPKNNYQTDRFIEIYNAGSATVDLTGWQLTAIGNDALIFTWELEGSIAPGQALVAGNPSPVTAFTVNFPDAGWNGSGDSGTWNGDTRDGVQLTDAQGTVIDFVKGLSFKDADMVRKPGILQGTSVFNAAEWQVTSVTLATDASPGTHIANSALPNPAITSITTDPNLPMPADNVHISAMVSDTLNAITSVVLKWGTTEASLGNSINMTLQTGNTYKTSSPIPAQPAGTTVFFMIDATNGSDQNSSALLSYSLPYVLSISDIQGTGSASPYEGKTVITEGTVTSVFGDIFTLQDADAPRHAMWSQWDTSVNTIVKVGDFLKLKGTVSENRTAFKGTTFLTDVSLLNTPQTGTNPYPVLSLATVQQALNEQYEAMQVKLSGSCSSVQSSVWQLGDEDATIGVDNLAGLPFTPILGTEYSVSGVIADFDGRFQLEPRYVDEIVFLADHAAPTVSNVLVSGKNNILITFSEKIDAAGAAIATNYTIDTQPAIAARVNEQDTQQVYLETADLNNGTHTLTVNGVKDTYGNTASNVSFTFTYLASNPPTGYYLPAEGLKGTPLRQALHDIIDNHDAHSYDYAWTAYRTTDVKPNGKVWDIYSDIPDGTPPYEYDFGTNEGGAGGSEGNGYTREHSFPKSWFGGTVMPMYADIFALYPCDAHVNGTRGNDPYGEVAHPDVITLNGSKKGNCTYPGYTGKAFEPIDAYKGDLARTYFYMTTRYFGEDAGWPGSPIVSGANLVEWGLEMMLKWHKNDPVSEKEINRNEAVYAIQKNRNPFIDHPEYVEMIYSPSGSIYLNDFSDRIRVYISSAIPKLHVEGAGIASVKIFDLNGRSIATLKGAGEFSMASLAKGVYIVQAVRNNGGSVTQKIIR